MAILAAPGTLPQGFELSDSGHFAYVRKLLPLPLARKFRDERLSELSPRGRLIVVRMGKTMGGVALAFDDTGVAEAVAVGKANRKRIKNLAIDRIIDAIIGPRRPAGKAGAA